MKYNLPLYGWKNILLCLMIFLLWGLVFLNSAYASSCSNDNLKKYAVLIEAYKKQSQNINTDPPVKIATGVLVSGSGLILTSYENLEDVIESQEVNLFVKDVNNDKRHNLFIIDFNKRRNVVLLKVSIKSIQEMELETPQIGQLPIDGKMKDVILCSVGFVESTSQPVSPEGKGEIVSNDGILIKTTFQFKQGQIGSPVFLQSNGKYKLIGITSSEDSSGAYYEHVTPIEMADALLSQVYVSNINNKVKSIESLIGERFEFYSPKQVEEENCSSSISYIKRKGGHPYIKEGVFNIKPFGVDSSGKQTWLTGFEETIVPTGEENPDNVDDPFNEAPRHGSFCLDKIIEKLKLQVEFFGITKVEGMQISLNLTVLTENGSEKTLEYSRLDTAFFRKFPHLGY